MKKKHNKYKLLAAFVLLFLSAISFAQVHVQRDTSTVKIIKDSVALAHSCPDEKFNAGVGNWKRSNYWPGHHENRIFIPTHTTIGPSGNKDQDYALDGFDLPGHDILFNQIDYHGNLRERGNYFCYEFKVITYAGKTTAKPEIVFYQGDMASFPKRKKEKHIAFVIDISIDTIDGWVPVCIPISEPLDGRLPKSKIGHWEVSGNTPVRDFNEVLTHADGVFFLLDLNTNPNEKYAFDNICIHTAHNTQAPPKTKGLCCGVGENRLANGDFEKNKIDFWSDYTSNELTLPGQFTVSTSAKTFGTVVKDYSYCTDTLAFAKNTSFLLVNGLTNQSKGSSAVVYEQNIALEAQQSYKLCVAFKNLPQRTFDVLPQVQIEANGEIIVPYTPIDTDTSNACDWMILSGCFNTGDKTNSRVSIRLKEDGLGDGNDLAIDDISLQRLADPYYNLTVPQGSGRKNITVTINPFPLLNKACDSAAYYWFVYQTTDAKDAPLSVKKETFAWSDGSGSYGPGLEKPGKAWNIPTTTFSNYTFQRAETYVIGSYIPGCCKSCYNKGWTYRRVTNSLAGMPTGKLEMGDSLKDEIRSLFVK